MTHSIWRQALLAIATSSALLLTGCGGSGGSSSSKGLSSLSTSSGVPGPLDPVQTSVSNNILGAISSAAAGTPIATTIDCLDQLIVVDVIDILDGLLAGVSPDTLSNPQALFDSAAPQLEMTVGDLAADLAALQNTFTGGACSFSGGSNPLAGTPLEALGASLAAVPAPPTGGDLSSLATYLDTLSSAFDGGLTAVPAGDLSSVDLPVLGGIITTVQAALTDLQTTVSAAVTGDPSAVQSGVSTTLSNLLNNLLTEVVPIAEIESLTSQQGLMTSGVTSGISPINALFGNGLDGLNSSSFNSDLTSALDFLVLPESNTLMTGLLSSISNASVGSTPTGTPMDPILGQLADLLSIISSPSTGLTESPLDLSLQPIADALANNGACPVAGTSQANLCTVVSLLQAAIASSPLANPLDLLSALPLL